MKISKHTCISSQMFIIFLHWCINALIDSPNFFSYYALHHIWQHSYDADTISKFGKSINLCEFCKYSKPLTHSFCYKLNIIWKLHMAGTVFHIGWWRVISNKNYIQCSTITIGKRQNFERYKAVYWIAKKDIQYKTQRGTSISCFCKNGVTSI